MQAFFRLPITRRFVYCSGDDNVSKISFVMKTGYYWLRRLFGGSQPHLWRVASQRALMLDMLDIHWVNLPGSPLMPLVHLDEGK